MLAYDQVVLILDIDTSDDQKNKLINTYVPYASIFSKNGAYNLYFYDKEYKQKLNPNLAFLMTTSGTTGSPKLSRFTMNNILANAVSISKYLKILKNDKALCHLPIYFSYGLSVINSHIISGASLYITNRPINDKFFWKILKKNKITSLSGVPFHFETIFRFGFNVISNTSIKTLTQAGGKLSPKLVSYFGKNSKKRNIDFYVMYGQTEAGPRISYLPPMLTEKNPDSVGVPIPGVDLKIVDSSKKTILDFFKEGELICESPAVMMGYSEKASDLERGDDLQGVLKTGDLAYKNANGLFVISGRLKRFVKLTGKRVNLDDLDLFLKDSGYNAVSTCDNEKLYIYIESKYEKDIRILKKILAEQFKISPVLYNINLIKKLPYLKNGKINYSNLQKKII